MPKREEWEEAEIEAEIEVTMREAPEEIEVEEVEVPTPRNKDLGEPVPKGSGGQFIKRNGKLYRA